MFTSLATLFIRTCQDRKQATPLQGIMRLPQISETGSTTDMDEAMQQMVEFGDYVHPNVLCEPELLKLVPHKHMVEYISIRKLEQEGYLFGDPDENAKESDVLLFTNFCNNYDTVKAALKHGQPEAWEKHIQHFGPGKIINIPSPQPTTTPEALDSQITSDLESLSEVIDSQEVQELAARGGWSKQTLTETVMQVLRRADTIDMQSQHAPPGSVAVPQKQNIENMAMRAREQLAACMEPPQNPRSKNQDQQSTHGKEPPQNPTSKNQDQQSTHGKEPPQKPTSKNQDLQGTHGKEPPQNPTSKNQDLQGTREGANSESDKQEPGSPRHTREGATCSQAGARAEDHKDPHKPRGEASAQRRRRFGWQEVQSSKGRLHAILPFPPEPFAND